MRLPQAAQARTLVEDQIIDGANSTDGIAKFYSLPAGSIVLQLGRPLCVEA